MEEMKKQEQQRLLEVRACLTLGSIFGGRSSECIDFVLRCKFLNPQHALNYNQPISSFVTFSRNELV